MASFSSSSSSSSNRNYDDFLSLAEMASFSSSSSSSNRNYDDFLSLAEMASFSSSSSSSNCNYDVFLSFHGKDTRKTFVSYLYAALCAKGVVTFKDDKGVEKGDHISTKLHSAIYGSQLAVVVLSENYVSSKWCLMELAIIMESYKLGTLKVFPIFYEVDPSDVRKQQGGFSLEHYQTIMSDDEISNWKKALTSIANLSGVDSRNWQNEYDMLERSVEDISSQLDYIQLTSLDDVVCVEGHTEQIKSLLRMESEGEARMVGIWGMGSIGKTTIAKYLYQQYATQFPFQCFIEDVNIKHKQDGLKSLQTHLLRDILHSKRLCLRSEQNGATVIRSRLQNLKVFVVIDGVDRVEQIYALAREVKWFGKGSRIIITTRDKRLLDSFREVNQYKVECLGSEDSLQMFKHFAFTGGVLPFDAFDEQLAIRASQLAHGLPFALEALGKYFRGTTSISQWESDIATFERAPPQNIMEILRSSYNNLEETTKLTFRRIACLFNGEHVSHVSSILDEAGGVRDLANKSLIHISDDGYIDMHSLIQQMGRDIVLKESKYKPQKQSILWDPHKSYGVLLQNTGTEKIEGMALHMCELPRGSLPIDGNAFNKLHNLRFLKLFRHMDDTEFTSLDVTSSNSISLSLDLKLLHWDAYPSTTLPFKFSLRSLVGLHLRYSNLESLWDGNVPLPMLKKLDVTGSKNLLRLPDLSSARNLEELITKGCTRLSRILDSSATLTSLRKLDVSDCDNLMDLEMTIREFPGSWKFYGDIVVTTYRLKHLSIQCQLNFRLDHLKGKAAHLSFTSEQELRYALTLSTTQNKYDLYTDFYGCKSLDIMQFTYEQHGPGLDITSFSKFNSLTELNLINLKMPIIPEDINLLQELQKLDLSGNDFPYLPKGMETLPKLKSLRLCNCRILRELPQLIQLETLKLSNCIDLRTFPHTSQYLYLQKLWLDNCKKIQNLSATLSHCTNLTYLDLSRNDMEIIPASLTSLSKLGTLCLNDCNNLRSLTNLPLSLKYLYAHGCKSLETFSISINHHVIQLDLSPCYHWRKDSSQITRFPASRSSEEALVCACLMEMKLPSTNQVMSPRSQRLNPFMWVYAFYFIVVGVEFILRMNELLRYSPRTSTIVHGCLNTLVMGIFLYRRLQEYQRDV